MSKYRVNPVKSGGRKNKFQVQKRVLFFFWQTLMNPFIVNNHPYEYRTRLEAEQLISSLSK